MRLYRLPRSERLVDGRRECNMSPGRVAAGLSNMSRWWDFASFLPKISEKAPRDCGAD